MWFFFLFIHKFSKYLQQINANVVEKNVSPWWKGDFFFVEIRFIRRRVCARIDFNHVAFGFTPIEKDLISKEMHNENEMHADSHQIDLRFFHTHKQTNLSGVFIRIQCIPIRWISDEFSVRTTEMSATQIIEFEARSCEIWWMSAIPNQHAQLFDNRISIVFVSPFLLLTNKSAIVIYLL